MELYSKTLNLRVETECCAQWCFSQHFDTSKLFELVSLWFIILLKMNAIKIYFHLFTYSQFITFSPFLYTF